MCECVYAVPSVNSFQIHFFVVKLGHNPSFTNRCLSAVEMCQQKANMKKLGKSAKAKSPLIPEEFSKILGLYLDEKTQSKALKLASQKVAALEMLVQFETMVALHKRQETSFSKEATPTKVHTIVEFAELFFNVDDPRSLEEKLKGNRAWQALKNNLADFSLFQDTLEFLFTWGAKPMVPTPAYLKKIILDRIYSEVPKEEGASIVIRIKDGLRLIAGHLQNVYNLTSVDDMVAVRSVEKAALEKTGQPTGALHFMAGAAKQGNLLYQVVKDGNETVMLTVKLLDWRPRPKFINLRKQGRLIHSAPLKDDFAWFAQLAVGDYEIELQDLPQRTGKRIDIHIVQ